MAIGLGAIRVRTVADSIVLRAGLRAMLGQHEGVVPVAEAADMARDTHPDVAIVDVREPGQINLRTCQELHAQGYGCKVLILTARSDEETIVDLIMDGASDYLLEDLSAKELHDAIHKVHEGGSPVDSKFLR